MKKVVKNLRKFLLAFAVLFMSIAVISPTIVLANAFGYKDYPDIYKQIAINFFKQQYDQQHIEYEALSVALEADLYDNEENVVAKSLVVKRDETYDYVVLNLTDSSIDEFVFDAPSAYEKFSKKIYYTGTLSYFTQESYNFKSIETGEVYSREEFASISNEITNKYTIYKKNASKVLSSNGNLLPDPYKDGYNGFYSFSDIYGFNSNNGYELVDLCFIGGITANGLENNSEEILRFYDQEEFNDRFNTTGSCGPTALTNLCILMQWDGVTNRDRITNALYLGDPYATFDRFRIFTNHDNVNGISTASVANAFKVYAEGQNYNCYVKENLTTFDQFKEHIYNGYPILTAFQLISKQTNKQLFAHGVLTVGYIQFRYYDANANKTLYNNYLRVVDGWDTSNQGRYIDFSGYWDDLLGIALRLIN